jgi:hypothetical protein
VASEELLRRLNTNEIRILTAEIKEISVYSTGETIKFGTRGERLTLGVVSVSAPRHRSVNGDRISKQQVLLAAYLSPHTTNSACQDYGTLRKARLRAIKHRNKPSSSSSRKLSVARDVE